MSEPELNYLVTPLLDTLSDPADLRRLKPEQLRQVADELRAELIDAVSGGGGHLGSGLGVVELTTALHYVFHTPEDRIVWDVGHQTYPHKILTQRRDRIRTLRRGGGLSGFTKRSESVYDPFGAAHSSTSVSAGLGMAVARDLLNESNRNVVCVIGDGAMSAGMAFEGLNNAGALKKKLIVILNDNDMSIAPPVGAMSAYLAKLWSGERWQNFRERVKKGARVFSEGLERAAKRAEEYAKGFAVGGTLFEELGFQYYGPVDGHDLDALLPVLQNLRDMKKGPVLLHVVTQKGKGFAAAERAADKYHGVGKFNPLTGEKQISVPKAPDYTSVFSKTLIDLAEKDDKIIAVTAAMPDGTGLDKFGARFPDRMFDVGIAEQHAVTFAAGAATEGMIPFVAIYSTFLQRAYDQIVHDVAIQNLPVRFMIDRAGLVGADGATHAGSFDIAYLCCLPNFVVMAAGDETDLVDMVTTAHAHHQSPCAVRYPRGEGTGAVLPERGKILPIGKGEIIEQGSRIALVSFGGRLREAKVAARIIEKEAGFAPFLVNAKFAKPLDTALLSELAKKCDVIVTLEEGSSGGFGSAVLQYLNDEGFLSSGLKVKIMTLPDVFQDQDTPEAMYREAGLAADQIAQAALSCVPTKKGEIFEAA